MNLIRIFLLMSLFTGLSANAPKVAVIGAGLAGLSTAYRLRQKGCDVRVYEARGRVGGRVLSVKIGDSIAELGGQNITDGGEALHMLGLIQEFDLELLENFLKIDLAYFTGKEMIPMEKLHDHRFEPESLQARLNELSKNSRNMEEVLQGLLPESDPLYPYLAIRLAAYEGGAIEKLSPSYTETLYHIILGGLAPVHPENKDIRMLRLKKGNSLLPEKMAETLGNRVSLHKVLTKVSKKDSFLLTFQDGETATADILVLAIPASVYEDITFEEGVLPLQRRKAIQEIHYGMNAKMILPFSTEPPKKQSLANDRVVSWFDLIRNIFTLYYTGESSRFSPETIATTYLEERSMIEKAFGTFAPPLQIPVYAKDESFVVYSGPIGYSWPNDPYVKGSYSYTASGQEKIFTEIRQEKGESVKTLFSPINGLYFAGEHTSITDAAGTMEAACESGERTARMILASF